MSIQFMRLGLIITLAIANFTSNSLTVLAQSSVEVSQTPPNPPDTGTPQGPQSGGATRPVESKCPVVKIPPIALMAPSVETIAESPTFWFYVPYAAQDVDSFSLTVLDNNHQYIQPQKHIPLSGTPGFISLRLPPTTSPLKIGKSFHWYFSIYCDRQNQEERISLSGVVKRIKLSSDPISGTPKERVTRYLENNLWYDAFNLLAELRRNNPQDPALQADWDGLLNKLNVSNIADQKFSQCCSINGP